MISFRKKAGDKIFNPLQKLPEKYETPNNIFYIIKDVLIRNIHLFLIKKSIALYRQQFRI